MNVQTEHVQAELEAAGTQYLRVLWCDHAGVIRVRSVRVRQLDGVRLSIPESSFALPVTGDRASLSQRERERRACVCEPLFDIRKVGVSGQVSIALRYMPAPPYRLPRCQKPKPGLRPLEWGMSG